MQLLSVDVITHMTFEKFAFRTFNRLIYNHEISGFLVGSYLFRLLDYYTLSNNVKFITLTIIWKSFLEFTLHIYNFRLTIDDFIILWCQTSTSLTMFNQYCC